MMGQTKSSEALAKDGKVIVKKSRGRLIISDWKPKKQKR